jgi:hypothetical protein
MSLNEVGGVAHALEELLQLVLGDTGEKTRIGDLIAVQMEDREHAPIPRRVKELVAVPAGGERAGFCLTVADDAGDDQIRVVERCPVCMAQRVAEFPALVDAAGGFRSDVAGDAAGEAELLEQLLHALRILADVRVDLAIGTLQIGVGDQGRPAVSGADDVDHVQVVALDDPIEMNAEHVQPRRCAPVAEQPRLDVLPLERLLHEGIVEEVDLADRQVVGGPPVGIHLAQLVRGQRTCRRGLAAVCGLPFHVGGYRCHVSFLVGNDAVGQSVVLTVNDCCPGSIILISRTGPPTRGRRRRSWRPRLVA